LRSRLSRGQDIVAGVIAWFRGSIDPILRGVVVLVVATIVLAALTSLWSYLTRRIRFWYAVALALLMSVCIFLWARWPLLRPLVTGVFGFGVGITGGLLWQRWPALSLVFGWRTRLSTLASRGLHWFDGLQSGSVSARRWQVVDSDPQGMVEATADGLLVSWDGGPPGYHQSGFLVAQLELDEGDFCVDFETKVEQYGTGWDAGVHLLVDAVPNSNVCASLRYLAAPWTKTDYNACCFVVGGEANVEFPFQVPVGEWFAGRIEVSGNKARATVGAEATGWLAMYGRPGRLVVGAKPVNWHAEGRPGRYSFRSLRVTPRHLG
jgi:hypothetical protein